MRRENIRNERVGSTYVVIFFQGEPKKPKKMYHSCLLNLSTHKIIAHTAFLEAFIRCISGISLYYLWILFSDDDIVKTAYKAYNIHFFVAGKTLNSPVELLCTVTTSLKNFPVSPDWNDMFISFIYYYHN